MTNLNYLIVIVFLYIIDFLMQLVKAVVSVVQHHYYLFLNFLISTFWNDKSKLPDCNCVFVYN